MRRILGFLLGVVTVGVPFDAALACRCTRVDDSAHLAATPINFSGRAMEKAPSADGRAVIYRFEVSETWKGDLPAVVAVRTPRSTAACGASFQPDQVYTVFATPFRQDLLETGACQLAPVQSRPDAFKAMLMTYRAQVAAWARHVVAAEDSPEKLRGEIDFLLANNEVNYRPIRLDAARADFRSALRIAPKSSLANRGLAALDRLAAVAKPARPDVQRIWPEAFGSAASP